MNPSLIKHSSVQNPDPQDPGSEKDTDSDQILPTSKVLTARGLLRHHHRRVGIGQGLAPLHIDRRSLPHQEPRPVDLVRHILQLDGWRRG